MNRVPRGTKFRRPIVVPQSLDELRGPDSGSLTIPLSVCWARPEPRVVNAGNDEELLWIYWEALGVASYEDLVQIINKDALIRLWPRLTNDRTVRAAWEARFPILAEISASNGQ